MSSPAVRYIGNFDVLGDGKFLFEILAQLRGFGVGRIVTKGEWLRRFPKQPSYCIVRKVRPQMDRWLWKGAMWAEWVYRGQNLGVYEFNKDLNKPDWRLIHMHQEAEFCSHAQQEPLSFVQPASIPLPPTLGLLKEKQGYPVQRRVVLERVIIDPEFEMLAPFMKQRAKMNPKKDIYDLDPTAYLDLYGEELPMKVEKWNEEYLADPSDRGRW